MIPKLSIMWDFGVFKLTDGSIEVHLWELYATPPRFKSWSLATGDVENLTHAMNSLTDELCEGFFPKPRLSKEEKKALKLANQATE